MSNKEAHEPLHATSAFSRTGSPRGPRRTWPCATASRHTRDTSSSAGGVGDTYEKAALRTGRGSLVRSWSAGRVFVKVDSNFNFAMPMPVLLLVFCLRGVSWSLLCRSSGMVVDVVLWLCLLRLLLLLLLLLSCDMVGWRGRRDDDGGYGGWTVDEDDDDRKDLKERRGREEREEVKPRTDGCRAYRYVAGGIVTTRRGRRGRKTEGSEGKGREAR